jgi:hypothetical protein
MAGREGTRGDLNRPRRFSISFTLIHGVQNCRRGVHLLGEWLRLRARNQSRTATTTRSMIVTQEEYIYATRKNKLILVNSVMIHFPLSPSLVHKGKKKTENNIEHRKIPSTRPRSSPSLPTSVAQFTRPARAPRAYW